MICSSTADGGSGLAHRASGLVVYRNLAAVRTLSALRTRGCSGDSVPLATVSQAPVASTKLLRLGASGCRCDFCDGGESLCSCASININGPSRTQWELA